MIFSKKTLSILAATALIGFATTATATDVIKIGVAGAHSGDLASYGIPTIKATKLVVDELNEQGGINGVIIKVLAEDDVCKPEIATNTATKLVSEKVNVVIGHICSGATKAAIPIYLGANLLVISPSATSPDLTQSGDYPNFYRTIASDDAQARVLVEYSTNILKAKKVAIIHDKGDYGKGLAEFVGTFIEQAGKIEIVLSEGVSSEAVDFSAIVQKIKKHKADTVIYGGYHPAASKIVSKMRKKRMKTKFIGPDGIKDDTFIKVAGKNAEGVFATGPADVSSNPIAQKFRAKFIAAEGAEPGAFFDNAVTAALVITKAIAKAGTDSDAIAKFLHTETTETPFGAVKFDQSGEPIGIGFVVYEVKDGKYLQVQ